MPLFEYRCTQCGEHFERLVSFRAEQASTPCPKCGATETRKLFSTFATTDRQSSTSSSTACAPTGG